MAFSTGGTTIDDIQLLHRIMERDFGVLQPRIALVDHNPVAENQFLEEIENKKMCVYGPYDADVFFEQERYKHFDAVMALDKEIISYFKPLAHEYGVRFFAGQQLIITSPYQDAQLSIAGKGMAETTSFHQSIFAAIDIIRNRENHDSANANPLPKLFHDKREERRNNNIE